ncbi:ABC-three component system protein [Paraburkholderia tropica]|uniref:ABC-three component system protein n=1 Tax=Paraburkholderia tropica TaxID=92647 RepID=UPI001590A99A|nr:ABC-three component system protein [Paraburkholderia tropica]
MADQIVKVEKLKKPIDTNAAAIIAAFIFQFERALYRLFSAPTRKMHIGLETLDDVAELTYKSDGSVQAKLEQDAHTVQSSGQPFRDSGRKLWHTLHVWLTHVDEIEKGYPDPRFVFVTNASVKESTLVRKLSKASSKAEVKEALKSLRAQAKEIGKSEESEAYAEAMAVNSYDDKALSYLIERVDLLAGTGSGSEANPREATIEFFQLPTKLVSHGEQIYQHLLGVLTDRCKQAWTRGETAWFTPREFKDLLDAEKSRHTLLKVVDRPEMSVDFKKYVTDNADKFLFVEQLSSIDLNDADIKRHLAKYWAYCAERGRLEEEGVSPTIWYERESILYERWADCCAEVRAATYGHAATLSDEDIGRQTLKMTLNVDYRAPLGEYSTRSSYFTHGHYHHLANDRYGQFFVYWHSQYGQKEVDEEGEG